MSDLEPDFTYSGWARKVHLKGQDPETGKPYQVTAFFDSWRDARGRFAGELVITGSFGTHSLAEQDMPQRFEEFLFGNTESVLRKLFGQYYEVFDAQAAYAAVCQGVLRLRRDRDWEKDETSYLWGDLVQQRERLLASDAVGFVQLVESFAEDAPYRLVNDYCASAGGFVRWTPNPANALARSAWEPLLAALATTTGEQDTPARPDAPRG